jgi:molybdopterin-guanine dinucleotide biosynthesis protein A
MSSTLNGLILAGGRSQRFGTDKAFAVLHGRPLIAHLIERLAPQVDRAFISSNAPAERFAVYGIEVIADQLGGYAGPLAGVHAALSRHSEAPLLSVAVDLPFLPRDLAARMMAAPLTDHCRYVALPRPPGHALAMLWPPVLLPALDTYLAQGERSMQDFLAAHGESVTLDPETTAALDFNINRPEDLFRAAAGNAG